jgi:CBS domain-containing protein
MFASRRAGALSSSGLMLASPVATTKFEGRNSKEVGEMLRVRDIMTAKGIYTVDFDASADEAAWGLTRREIGAAPVRNRQGELVGMLTQADLVEAPPRGWG